MSRVLAEIGLNPLFIINKKENPAAQLKVKSIHLKSGIVFISPEETAKIKKYRATTKDGNILVAEGVIIDDFSEEMKMLDRENKKNPLKKVSFFAVFLLDCQKLKPANGFFNIFDRNRPNYEEEYF